MNKIKFIFASALAVAAISSCLKEEAIVIQKPYTYDEQYFENLREYKKSKHTMSYVYYAAWAPLEGLTGYKDPASWGERIMGLPDSLDICNLWMGYPSPNPESESYAPVAYADMKYAQEKLGTRFVLHGDAATTRDVVYKGDTLNIQDLYNQWKAGTGTEEAFREALHNHAKIMIDKVNEAGLDGVDVDWEPQPAVWKDKQVLVDLMAYLRKNLPGKLIILDLFSDIPPAEVNEYIDYLVIQCYTPQIGCSVANLKNFYTTRGVNAGIPAEKIICCEQGGQTDYALNGGGLWKETNGGTQIYTTDGSKMYSFEGFARHTSENNMAGWGVFYVDRNYYSTKGPYYEFRKGIQVANPSIR
ncbi:MAG: glycosyl hydrolase [Bacteroidales bacterium]|nr:glycosyl hydrolase [Bacteroidales bacterium]